MSNNQFSEFGYLGNIWGWRWSIIAAIFILAVLLLMYARYEYLVANDAWPAPVQDSIELYEH